MMKASTPEGQEVTILRVVGLRNSILQPAWYRIEQIMNWNARNTFLGPTDRLFSFGFAWVDWKKEDRPTMLAYFSSFSHDSGEHCSHFQHQRIRSLHYFEGFNPTPFYILTENNMDACLRYDSGDIVGVLIHCFLAVAIMAIMGITVGFALLVCTVVCTAYETWWSQISKPGLQKTEPQGEKDGVYTQAETPGQDRIFTASYTNMRGNFEIRYTSNNFDQDADKIENTGMDPMQKAFLGLLDAVKEKQEHP